MRIWLTRALAAVGLLLVLVTFTPLVPWWSGLLAGDWDADGGDILIVLASEMIGDRILGVNSYWRTIYAWRTYETGKFRKVVVAGAGVAPAMRDLLVYFGVPADRIVVENGSTSTRENALFTARLLAPEPGRKVLVTSDMHMLRARRAFARAGLRVTGAPFPYGRKLGNHYPERWGLFLGLVTETAKTAGYYLRGWI